MARRKISREAGAAAVAKVIERGLEVSAIAAHDDADLALAVRFLLEELAAKHPGRALEVRVPPFGATQCLTGPSHTRGTPPGVIECGANAWVGLATGMITWQEALNKNLLNASGVRADLNAQLPLEF